MAMTSSPPPSDVQSDGLRALRAEEIAGWELAMGDIFFAPPGGRRVRLKRAGDWLDEAWRRKVGGSGHLRWRPAVRLDQVARAQELWAAWEAEVEPASREDKLERLGDWLRAGFAGGQLSLLDWSVACHRMFKPDAGLVGEYAERHVVLQRRGLHVSALAVLFGLACGYDDPGFLRELHQMAWLLDLGLLDDDFTYRSAAACEKERMRPGSGAASLKAAGASEAELRSFLEHPVRGHARATAEWGPRLSHPALLACILRHHELADGSGFPEGLALSGLADWEALMGVADHLVGYREEELESYAHRGFLELWGPRADKLPPGLPARRVRECVAGWFTPRREAA